VREEVERSKARIEEAIDATVESFCYPNGDWDRRATDAVRRAGYRRAVGTRWGSNRLGAADPLTLRRCELDGRRLRDRRGECSEDLLSFRLSGLDPRLAISAS
jgi:peptidoglycan/xylan/chitin deacetylase (PgdA/CDA1 family)